MKKAVWLALGLALMSSSAHARIYKCIVGGSTTFQQLPCAAEAQTTEVKLSLGSSQEYPWSGLRAGMSVDEVRAQVAGARSPSRAGRLANGAVARLEKPVSVAGVPFVAVYYFLQGRYYQVNVSRAEVAYGNDAVRVDYEKVEPVMLRAFGVPGKQVRLEQTRAQLKGKVEWEGARNQWTWLAITPVTSELSMLTFGHRPAGVPRFEAAPVERGSKRAPAGIEAMSGNGRLPL